jgi:DsbC/DsbD-like thiol-disulfide interchange protein
MVRAMPIRIALLAALATLAPAAASAEALTQDQILTAALLPGWQTESGTRMSALRLDLAPHWKTYWRSPGDAGIPPEFDWSGSKNLKAVHIHWPVPEVFHLNGMQTIGYVEELVLPLEVVPQDPARPVELHARVDLGVCNDICIPATVTLAASLSGPGAPDRAIADALAHRPETPREAGLTDIACDVEPTADGLRVTARIVMPAHSRDETVVFEPGRPGIWSSEAETSRDDGQLIAVSEMGASSGQPFALDRSALTLTILSKGRSVEIPGCPAD